jgi:hypothetical protein
MLSDFKDQILELLEDNFFGDDQLKRSITYDLYKGRSTAAQSFTIASAVMVKHKVTEEELEDGVMAQRARRKYIIRETDLPAGVTFNSLTKNDHITDGSAEFIVEEIDKTLEFILAISAVGAQ